MQFCREKDLLVHSKNDHKALNWTEARSIIWVSHVVAGAQELQAFSDAFQYLKQGAEWEEEQSGREPVPKWDACIYRQKLANLAVVTAQAVLSNTLAFLFHEMPLSHFLEVSFCSFVWALPLAILQTVLSSSHLSHHKEFDYFPKLRNPKMGVSIFNLLVIQQLNIP